MHLQSPAAGLRAVNYLNTSTAGKPRVRLYTDFPGTTYRLTATRASWQASVSRKALSRRIEAAQKLRKRTEQKIP